jgi:hypothetical protein
MFKKNCCTSGNEKRGPRFIGRVVRGIVLAAAFAVVFGIFVHMLWNWLMPPIFNLGTITWGQAIGLMLLARLLFGSMCHHRGDHRGPGKHGFRHFAWPGCGCSTEDDANHEIKDWRHYDAWWNTEGRDAFKKYADGSKEGGSGER